MSYSSKFEICRFKKANVRIEYNAESNVPEVYMNCVNISDIKQKKALVSLDVDWHTDTCVPQPKLIKITWLELDTRLQKTYEHQNRDNNAKLTVILFDVSGKPHGAYDAKS